MDAGRPGSGAVGGFPKEDRPDQIEEREHDITSLQVTRQATLTGPFTDEDVRRLFGWTSAQWARARARGFPAPQPRIRHGIGRIVRSTNMHWSHEIASWCDRIVSIGLG